MLAKVLSSAVIGIDAYLVEVEVEAVSPFILMARTAGRRISVSG